MIYSASQPEADFKHTTSTCFIKFTDNCFLTNYSFPDEIKSPELHGKWVQGLNSCSPVEIVPVQDSRVCSEHFSTEMFDN